MTCSDKYITLFRGDDTNFNGQQFLTFNLTTDALVLSECKAKFTLGNIIQTIDDISTGTFQVNFTSAQTASMPSTGFATLAVIDGTGKHGTLSNTIPYRVVSQTHNNAIVTEPYTLNFDVKQGGETILNVSVEAGVSVEVGTTTTLPAGADATVTNVGSFNHLILDFGIPQGIQGEQGEQGEPGEKGDCYFATFDVEDGYLIMNKADEMTDIDFEIVNSNLEVIING